MLVGALINEFAPALYSGYLLAGQILDQVSRELIDVDDVKPSVARSLTSESGGERNHVSYHLAPFSKLGLDGEHAA